MNKKSLAKDIPKKAVGKFRFGRQLYTTEAGRHTAEEITLSEVAINNHVLRVHLDTTDLSEEKSTPVNKQEKQKVSPGESLLRKKLLEPNSATTRKTSVGKQKSEDNLNNNNRESTSKNRSSSAGMETSKQGQIEPWNTTPTKSYTYTSPIKRNMTAIRSSAQNGVPQKYVIRKQPKNITNAMDISDGSLGSKLVAYEPRRNLSESNSIRYYLEYEPDKLYEERLLNYKFSKLAVDVRSLRLPAPHWKIKIYMRNKAISSIAFTNKNTLERVLKFSALSNSYEMIIDNKKAELLGCPVTVDSRQDVECLLDILHCITSDNPMIIYKH